MGIQIIGGGSADLVGVGESAGVSLHTTNRPAGADGHYLVSHRMVLVATQAANSRLFEIRNPTAGKLMVLTRLRSYWLTASAHTAIIEDSLDAYRCTTFTVSSTTATVALVSSLKRTGMAADTMLAKGATVAGVAAGMTGHTATKDTSPFGQHPMILPLAVMAATETLPRHGDMFDHVDPTLHLNGYPYTFAQNEGIVVENRALLGAAAGSSAYFVAEYFVCDAF